MGHSSCDGGCIAGLVVLAAFVLLLLGLCVVQTLLSEGENSVPTAALSPLRAALNRRSTASAYSPGGATWARQLGVLAALLAARAAIAAGGGAESAFAANIHGGVQSDEGQASQIALGLEGAARLVVAYAFFGASATAAHAAGAADGEAANRALKVSAAVWAVLGLLLAALAAAVATPLVSAYSAPGLKAGDLAWTWTFTFAAGLPLWLLTEAAVAALQGLQHAAASACVMVLAAALGAAGSYVAMELRGSLVELGAASALRYAFSALGGLALCLLLKPKKSAGSAQFAPALGPLFWPELRFILFLLLHGLAVALPGWMLAVGTTRVPSANEARYNDVAMEVLLLLLVVVVVVLLLLVVVVVLL